MHIFDADTEVVEVIGKVLGHLFGQGGDQNALVFGGALIYFGNEVVDLSVSRFDDDFRVDKSRRTDDLLGHLRSVLFFKITGGCRNVDRLVNVAVKLVKA